MISLSRIGASPQKEAQFKRKHITSVEELTMFFPRKYYDFREKKAIKDLRDGDACRVSGIIHAVYPGSRRSSAILSDGTADLQLNWFGGCYFFSRLSVGTEWTFCGKVSEYYGKMQMTQPMLHAEGGDAFACIYPVYSKISGMSDKYLQEMIGKSLALVGVSTPWTEQDSLAKTLGLVDGVSALREMHKPTSQDSYKDARRRVVYDQIYQFQEELYTRAKNKSFCPCYPMPEERKTRAFIKSLPFAFTTDQESACEEIFRAVKTEKGLNALITGDVGCGKTVVALVAAVLAHENGFQTVIMAPTLVLAQQHFREMASIAKNTGIQFALLTSETKARERGKILSGIKDHTIDVLIGTSSVISPELEFGALGMTIVDEEHRFGARQKQMMEIYDKAGAHHLSMTATPIPRSYASTVYGDSLSIITIETMPAGRKPVITTVEANREAVYRKLLDEVGAGHQAYVVCPLIEDSDSGKFQSVLSVETVAKELSAFCRAKAPGVQVACISGDMKQKKIMDAIGAFADGTAQILVSTTIVEVGVNVPNATAIAIMSADRFGLSALHQLRGRVGRGRDQGYCYLVSSKSSERLDVLAKYSSGFKIAELDMALRGPGDILGEDQTGDSKIIDLMLRWPKITKNIRLYFSRKP